MRTYRVDLHVHLGRAMDRPVKITASRELTLSSIIAQETPGHPLRKGLDCIGVVDAVATGARAELRQMVAAGELTELPGGGLAAPGGLVLIPGAEVETTERVVAREWEGHCPTGAAHWVAYFPSLDALNDFACAHQASVSNNWLSTQRSRWSGVVLAGEVAQRGGVLVPAHAFTPHKGVLGCCTDRLDRLLPVEIAAEIPAVELGLSADTAMAARLPELDSRIFFSNSDAHSLAKLGREYNLMLLPELSFQGICSVFTGTASRAAVVANYGLSPRLGKYHRTYCHACEAPAETSPPVYACTRCGGTDITFGVADRLAEIAERPETGQQSSAVAEIPSRPPYHYQIPLEFVPGIGKRAIQRLVAAFGSELAAMHEATPADLAEVVGERAATLICNARHGLVSILDGGGGRYGRLVAE